MAWADLTAAEQQMVKDFTRNYRAAVGSTVRGLRQQSLLAKAYTDFISDLFAQIGNDEVIPDNSGLAGANLEMTKADFSPVFQWTNQVLNAIYDDGGAVATNWPDSGTVDGYGVELAGPTNIS